ncbi:MAG: ABC transporter substrate-binding protein [Desulfobacterales bacterium]|nr:ABC transporter substrate-binding protein [Desulfobacterales bacterium]
MHRIKKLRHIILLLFLSILLTVNAMPSEKKLYGVNPITNNGKKWRIGYYEGGDFSNYYNYLSSIVYGLMDLGWIEHSQIPQPQISEAKSLWHWLSTEMNSNYLEFVQDAFYSNNWNKDQREIIQEQIINRLNQKKDLDIMLAMGTWAGKDLANNRHHTNTMVISTSDPVGAGIIISPEDSGYDHIHARVDPYRYESQLRAFHDVIKFKKLGVSYEDSLEGKSYAAINSIKKIAAERHFKIVTCNTQTDITDVTKASQSVINCFRELAPKVDAIYVTVQTGVNYQSIPELVRITNENKIPTFSQFGSEEVQYGFLLSLSRAGGFKPEGRFLAATFAQICNGAKPRELNQIFKESSNIAINLKTAETIGIYLYADLLVSADEIFRYIKIPEKKKD